ncbi:MAG: hypothetical protein JWR54_3417 [Mucilaginibacter sp.]|nr:hypothetical protein [Mucilaginibacter sp.]
MKKILITTTESLHGWEIETYLKPIFANVVVGAGFLSDFNASITDFFGGRSNSYEKKLQTVNDSALNILKSKAGELGANCILGLKVDLDQISGKNVQMFMVTAYGTAVIAKSISSPKPIISSKEIDKTTVNDKATLLKLLNDIKSPAYELTAISLQTIVDSKSSDFKGYIFGKFKTYLSLTMINEETFKDVTKLYKEYFANIDAESAINVLYEALLKETDIKLLNQILEMINQYDLVDYDYCEKLLKSDSLMQKKLALKILYSDKPFYITDDINKLKQISDLIQSSFNLRATLSTKKGFMSSNEKEVWICECGKSNSADDQYCNSCTKDKFGFKANEVKRESVLESLENKSQALKEFFSVN